MASASTDPRGVVLNCGACGQKNRIPFANLSETGRCGKCGGALPPVATTIAVSSKDDFEALMDQASVPVLVDFWAGWCGPCLMVAPELEKVAAASAGQLVIAKVDTEAVPELSAQFGIRGIPTLMLFRGGHEVGRQSGAMPAAGIQAFVEEKLAKR